MKARSIESDADGWGASFPAKLLFIVGSPRSGTTWLQLLISQHQAVVTSPETQLWAQYLVRMEDRWRHERDRSAGGLKASGLTQVLSEEQFLDLLRRFASGVFEIVKQENPAAAVMLEKSPSHAEHAESILRLFPDAFFLHMIRDPRGVAASFRQAGRTWWKGAPTGAIAATERWRRTVEAGRAIGEMTGRYREVRYEELLDDGVRQLASIFQWLDLPADREFCQKALDHCRIEKLRAGSSEGKAPWSLEAEPAGFFRRGTASGWRDDLSPSETRAVERVAGDLMDRLGYVPVSGRTGGSLRLGLVRVIAGLRSALQRVAAGVDWRLRDLLRRL